MSVYKLSNKFERDYCKKMFLSYWNDFLTVEKFAEHYNISLKSAKWVIRVGKIMHNQDCNKS